MSDQLVKGSAEWWLDRLLRRMDARKGRPPGTRPGRTRNEGPSEDPGSPGMLLYDAYYRGDHRQTYKIRKVIDAFGLRMPLFVNYCGVVVDALAERIGVSGFNFHDDDAASEAASEMWSNNNLDAAFTRGIREGLVKGEFSLSVWPDQATAEPRICVEDPLEVIVAVDPANPSDRRAALKVWVDVDEGTTYATVYLPDGLWKYELASDRAEGSFRAADRSWQPRVVEGEAFPLPNPFGQVPIFPVPNRPSIRGVGVSELELVVPIQDAINANVANVMLAGLYGAFRQKWVTNFQPEVDPKTKQPIMPWNIAEDSLFTAPMQANGVEVKFGEFSETDLGGYINLHELFVQALATTTRLPANYFLGNAGVFPSGESLSAVERGLAGKAAERGLDIKDPLEDAQRFAFLVASQNEAASSAARRRYAKWAAMTDASAILRDPEVRSESQHIDALGKRRQMLGYPLRKLWRMDNQTDDDIRQMEAWRAEEAAAAPPAPVNAGAGGPVADPTPAPAGDPSSH